MGLVILCLDFLFKSGASNKAIFKFWQNKIKTFPIPKCMNIKENKCDYEEITLYTGGLLKMSGSN